jgi:molybdate transport system substrate-binding protein
LLACLVVGGLAGCDGRDEGQQEEKGSTLTVLAASSLTDAFGELESTFEEQNQGIEVTTSFASSSDLLTQIQQGAPGDVFASADEAKMETAVEEGLVDGLTIFARNSPVVIVPANNPADIQDFQDLAQVQAQLVLAEDGVPIAEYAEDVLANADSQYGAGFGQTVLDKIVSREANVRASGNRVALGEADATFVYRSDVTEDIRDQVQVIEVPENIDVPATYPIAAIVESQHPELAQEWIDLVMSDEGQGVLEEYGFERAR